MLSDSVSNLSTVEQKICKVSVDLWKQCFVSHKFSGVLGIFMSLSVVSGYSARFEIQASRVKSNFSGRKNPEHKSSERDFKLGDQSLRFQAH